MALELVWDSELIFHAAGGHALTTDSEGQAGYSPTQLLAEAVMGCMAMDVVHILKKGRHDLQGLTVTFDGQRAETHPKKFVKIHLTFNVKGNVPREAVERAIELSPCRRCSNLRATSCVAFSDAPSGSHRSTRISGRLESGKNCCCTRPMPATPSPNTSTVMPMVHQRWATHQFTATRKRL